MPLKSQTLLLIGCGKMGRAMLDGWKQAGILESLARLYVLESNMPDLSGYPKTELVRNLADFIEFKAHYGDAPDIVFLAVKPQDMEGVLESCRQVFGARPLYVTIAAGKEISFYQNILGQEARVVRAMPNTPATIGKGVTGWFAAPEAGQDARAAAQALFSAVGYAFGVAREDELHAVTAAAGSGPAYVFRFVEAWAKAAESLGLPEDLALRLAKATLIGSAALLEAGGKSPAELRQNVASPGGTTAAGLEAMDAGIDGLLQNTLAAADSRSREMANGS